MTDLPQRAESCSVASLMSPAAGIICLAKPGEQVEQGQPLLELRADDESRFGRAVDALAEATEIGEMPPDVGPQVLERISL